MVVSGVMQTKVSFGVMVVATRLTNGSWANALLEIRPQVTTADSSAYAAVVRPAGYAEYTFAPPVTGRIGFLLSGDEYRDFR